ncbi:hypothetical protein BJY04DRAFT_231360 [Aspergillus karnatakaensis]|uniref:FAD-binding oxidoreductase n=1 Tax=Aspergillus karnatakaensis TaxID=1810916 RepID=UPI003CCDA872
MSDTPSAGGVETKQSRTSNPTLELDLPPRWSQLGVSCPAGVVSPASETEIVDALRYASDNRLQVLPVAGGQAPYVSIDENTLVLNMRKFNNISVGVAEGTITFGGGAIAAEVIDACAAEGVYTLTPNSNAVGMVGFLLGGGSTALNGIHGLAADHILSVRIITATSRILTLDNSSTDDEADLFATLRGAGHGLGVITSITMPIFPVSDLNLENNCAWVRRLMFPVSAAKTAAHAFLHLVSLQETNNARLVTTLVFMRAPPGTAHTGEPIMALTAAYYGPAHKAKDVTAAALNFTVFKHATSDRTTTIPFHEMNDRLSFLNVNTGYKKLGNALLRSVDVESLQRAFDAWIAFGDKHEDARARSIMMWGGWHVVPSRSTLSERNIFLPEDGRSVYLENVVWFAEDKTVEAAMGFVEDMLDVPRKMDRDEGVAAATFATGQRAGGGIREKYSERAIMEINRVKRVWDGRGLFWWPGSDY